ncbi:MAG: NAD(P)-dependent alcohol dehydrogenase [Holophagaceae bacterium]|nr:NAD(P)-dependent alcohol dehydrogenase [Holophagaceae bacterium]
MNAVVFSRYGSPDVLEFKEIAKPSPLEREVLVRIHATSLNEWDDGALRGEDVVNRLIFGLFAPKWNRQILGSDIAGVVEAVGHGVTRFKPGDAVYGDLSGRWGGFAEFVCAPESALATKPPGMTFEQAAAIPQAGLLAFQALRMMGPMRPGQSLLINGAGGGVGTFALQLLKPLGVVVSAVDSAAKLELLRELGATQVHDYAREDFTQGGQRYDFILDVKTLRSVLACTRALKPGGTYVTVGGSMARLFQALLLWPWIALVQRKKIRLLALKANEGLESLNELFEAGKLAPVVDRCFGLEETVAAFRFYGTGQHKGKVVITVVPES